MTSEHPGTVSAVNPTEHSPHVDVIIPVYLGMEETRRCLESVLRFAQQTPFELIVIDDCTPLPELQTYLGGLAVDGRITLIRNTRNRGFVSAANQGMTLHQDRDVVLLNSDTEVHGDWLDRLVRCAYSSTDVATVTPFSNNATICSYPEFLGECELPEDCSLERLDRLFGEVNEQRYVSIPTAVGFCMFIKRRCLNEVGYFDVVNYKRGYGEENDFCMRAMNLGFMHLLCGDTFVYHKGRVSFTSESHALCDEAQKTLAQTHPLYNGLVHEHIVRDPARSLRRRIDLMRIAESGRRKVLYLAGSPDPEIDACIEDMTELFAEDHEVLVLRPGDEQFVSVEWARKGEEFACYFPLPGAYQELLAFLKSIDVSWANIHHVSGLPHIALQIPGDLGIGYDIQVHDYYMLCPQRYLTDPEGRYCGEPDESGCNACLAARPAPWGLDIASWRETSADLLRRAHRVLVPTRDAFERFERYVPGANLHYFPYPDAEQQVRPATVVNGVDELKIVVISGNFPSALRLLESCAVDAQARGLPLSFELIDAPDPGIRDYPELPLVVAGDGDEAQLGKLIERARGDIIFFPATWPVIYPRALGLAIHSGLPVAAPGLGGFPERLEDYALGHVLDPGTSAPGWNDFFLSLLDRKRHGKPAIDQAGKNTLKIVK